MSWDLPAMLTILSIGVLNDDDAKIKQALEFFYHGKGMGCIEWSVKGMHEDPAGKVKGRHLAQSQEMGRDQGHATLNVGLHAYFCRTAYNMGIDLFAYNDNIILDLCEYTAKYNLTSAEDVEMPFEPYYHPNTVGTRRCRPTVKGVPSGMGTPLQPLCQGERYECSIFASFCRKRTPRRIWRAWYCRSR